MMYLYLMDFWDRGLIEGVRAGWDFDSFSIPCIAALR
jgi:hypothetical protein